MSSIGRATQRTCSVVRIPDRDHCYTWPALMSMHTDRQRGNPKCTTYVSTECLMLMVLALCARQGRCVQEKPLLFFDTVDPCRTYNTQHNNNMVTDNTHRKQNIRSGSRTSPLVAAQRAASLLPPRPRPRRPSTPVAALRESFGSPILRDCIAYCPRVCSIRERRRSPPLPAPRSMPRRR